MHTLLYTDPSDAITELWTRGAIPWRFYGDGTDLRRRFGNKVLWKPFNKNHGDTSSQTQCCETNGEDRYLARDEQFYMNLEVDDSSEDQREDNWVRIRNETFYLVADFSH